MSLMLSPSAESLLAKDTIGPILVGLICAVVLLGIANFQLDSFSTRRPEAPSSSSNRRPLWRKLIVSVLSVLHLAQLVVLSATIWKYLITERGDVSGIIHQTSLLSTSVVIGAFIDAICEIFSGWRVKLLSGWDIVFWFACFAAFSRVVLIISGVIIFASDDSFSSFKHVKIRAILISFLALGALTDIVSSVTLAISLLRRRSVFERTNYILARYAKLSIETGTPTTIASILALILLFAQPDNNALYVPINVIPGLYINCLFSMLNARLDKTPNKNLNVAKSGKTQASFDQSRGIVLQSVFMEHRRESSVPAQDGDLGPQSYDMTDFPSSQTETGRSSSDRTHVETGSSDSSMEEGRAV